MNSFAANVAAQISKKMTSMESQPNISIYFWEQKRLDSFVNWSSHWPLRPEELARAGFFYYGQNDRVRCAFCGQLLGQWSPGDTAIGEHRRYFPQCPFLLDPIAAGNVPIPIATNSFFNPGLREERLSIPVQESQGIKFTEDSLRERPSHLNYGTYESRLSTFGTYPTDIAQRPPQLAEAGFYYTGVADSVKCFFCNGGLRDWDPPDNPWTEHARWFPQCGFLKLAKGEDFIRSVTESYHHQDPVMQRPGGQTVQFQQAKRLGFNDAIIQSAITKQMHEKGQPFSSSQDLVYAIQSMQQMSLGATNQQPLNTTTQNTSPFYTPAAANNTSSFHPPATANNTSLFFTPPAVDNTHSTKVKVFHDDEMEIQEESLHAPGGATGTTVITATTSTQQKEKKKEAVTDKDLERTIQNLEEERTCKICMDEKANVVFLDCGHLICCENCATQVKKCPMCRQIIKKIVKTFMS